MYTIFHQLPATAGNLTGQELAGLFFALRDQGLASAVFYDRNVRRAADFVEMMEDDGHLFYLVAEPFPDANRGGFTVRGKRPLAFCWLNNPTGGGAMIHFCVFRAGAAQAERIGRFVTRMLLLARPGCPVPQAVCGGTSAGVAAYMQQAAAQQAAEGGHAGVSSGRLPGYCLDALYGMTPLPFRHALDFVTRLGFRRMGTLPFAARVVRRGQERLFPAVLTCLTRQEL